jgi:hypothetical protein
VAGTARRIARLSALVAGTSAFLGPEALAQTCGFGAGGTLTGVVNTYYPGVSVNAARTQVTVDTANRFPAANPAIAAGDMVLIIQTQDAQINASNNANYGSNSGTGSGVTALNNSGLFEFAVATSAPNGAGTFDVVGANPAGDGTLIRSYVTNTTPSGSRGQRTFQVVRIPQYSSATLSSGLTASAWNGRAGGILAIDVSGVLTLAGATVSVDGLGFRGGVGRARGGSGGTAATDYRTSVALNPNGMKGEGIVGTPDVAGSGSNGYPNGDMARGAPGTAGGGGTDGNPSGGNDQNTGGGGGANWGSGGQGGHGWLNNPSPCPPISDGSQTGGRGGTGVTDATRLLLGGGGGAGSRNNPGPSHGAAGGGMILFRVGAVSGSATLTARGTRPLSSANDGGGGGGAGGAIVVVAATGNLDGLSADASGGQGGYTNLNSPPAPDPPPGKSGSHHGPGGGGGGGVIRLSSAPVAPATTSVAGGASGLTNTCPGDNVTQAYGATGGAAGDVVTSWTLSDLAGVQLCTLLTRATVVGLSADGSGRVELAVGSRRRTRGFNVYGSETAAGPEGGPLNGELILAGTHDSSTPSLYRADVGGPLPRFLWIEEVETSGRSRFLGPYDREDETLERAFEDLRGRVLRAGERSEEARRERASGMMGGRSPAGRSPRSGATRPLPTLRNGAPTLGLRALRIEVDRAGTVRLPLADLQGHGMPAGALGARTLRLSRLGRTVPFSVEAEALVFQAEPLATDFTDKAPYVLAWGLLAPPLRVALSRSELERLPGHVRIEENRYYAPYLPPDTDPWIWDLAFAGWGGGPWSFDLPGLLPAASGVPLRLRVVGGTNHHHRVQALVNGALAAEAEWDGVRPALLEGALAAGVLKESGNILELAYEASGPEEEGLGILYLDALDVGAAAAPLRAEVEPTGVFPYDPLLPSLTADYLVVAPAAFRAAAERLAAAKEAEGLRAKVVDLERAYDHYSAGAPEAQAVRALLAQARRRGGVRYALLLGDDTFDPKGHLGDAPEVFVPSLLGWDGEFGRVPSENLYADTNGDGRPELAIGRLPARTSEEAQALAEKVSRQAELLAPGGRRVLFAVDRSGAMDSPFRQVAEGVASRHFAGRRIGFADLAEGVASAREALTDALRGGAGSVHYFGHGGPETWSDAPLLTSADAAGLEGSGAGAVVLSWACESQWYQYHLGPSVNESLLLVRGGGAVAAFGPAGISDPSLQRALYEAVYSRLGQGLSLGEAVRRAKADALKADPRALPVVAGFNLLGDPALRFPGDRRAPGVLP